MKTLITHHKVPLSISVLIIVNSKENQPGENIKWDIYIDYQLVSGLVGTLVASTGITTVQ